MTDLQIKTKTGRPQTPTKTNRTWKPVAGAVALFLAAVTVVAINTVGTDNPTGRPDVAVQAEIDRLNGLADKFAQTQARQAEAERLEALAAWVLQQQAEATAERSEADKDLGAQLSTAPTVSEDADRIWDSFQDRYPTIETNTADSLFDTLPDRYTEPVPAPFQGDHPGASGGIGIR